MSRPLVLLDALLVNRRPTGVGRAILELTAELARTDRGLDFAVAVTEPDMFAHLATVPGWRIVDCPAARGGNLRKAWYTQTGLPRLCRRLGVDLLHSLQFVAPLRPGCPLVVTVHDLAWQLYPETVEQPRRSYYRLFVPTSLRRADAVVCNSAATAADVTRLHPRVGERVVPTPFGTPHWVWEAARTNPAEQVPRRSRFLFVGTLEPRKNLERLLDAYDLARGRATAGFPALLLVGGRGWRDSGLRRRMEELATSGQLEVRDYCEVAELWDLYRNSLALLFPSRHEGFGFPILEAMVAGLPVLTADRGAMAEVAGDAGLLVDPDSTSDMAAGMERLAGDPQLREDLRERGAKRAGVWTWERTATATLTVYRDLLGLTLPGR